MPHDGTGTGWTETSPANSHDISAGAREIRDLRIGLRLRLKKEHEEPAGGSAGGEHLKGSARAFYQDTEPADGPSGDTLGADDDGRLLVTSDSKQMLGWSGSEWEALKALALEDSVGTDQLQDDSVVTDKIADEAVTQAKLEDKILTADADGRAKMADGFVTAAKLEFGAPARVFIGTYTGDGGTNNQVTGVGFEPDFIILRAQMSLSRAWRAGFKDAGGHLASLAGDGVNLDAITFESDGFTLTSNSTNINQAGTTYHFMAVIA